jgi:hypothetical protein
MFRYAAFKAGRAEKDPSEFWYKEELGFFNFYTISLAKKLSECVSELRREEQGRMGREG